MQCRWVTSKIGDVRTVAHCENSYNLPDGLPVGATVEIVDADHGYYTVEYEGSRFEIFCMCVVHPIEYLLDGEWLPEGHAVVRAEFAKPKHLRRVA